MLKGKEWIATHLGGVQSEGTLRPEDLFSMYNHIGTSLCNAMNDGSLEMDKTFVYDFTNEQGWLIDVFNKDRDLDAIEVYTDLSDMDDLINEILYKYNYELTTLEGDGACFIVAEIQKDDC